MSYCEDFPCCGHEPGCCPDFDPDTGIQLNMKCVCGAVLPVTARSSICDSCLRDPDDPDSWMDREDELEQEDDDAED